MKIEPVLGDKPTEPGLYCARQWYGYRILEWDGEKWWHPGKSAEWGKAEIEAYIGPLPTISKDYTKPHPHRGRDNRQPQQIYNETASAEMAMRSAEPEAWETQFPGAPSPAAMEFDL